MHGSLRRVCLPYAMFAAAMLAIPFPCGAAGPSGELELASVVEVAVRNSRAAAPRSSARGNQTRAAAQRDSSPAGAPVAIGSAQKRPSTDPVGDDGASTDASADEPADEPSAASSEAVELSPRPVAELTPELEALRYQVRRTLGMYYPRHLNARDHTPWEVMHGIIAYGVETKLYPRGPAGETVNAVAWLCWDKPCRGLRMLYLDRGRINAKKDVDLQGHHGQMLAILAQSHVPSDYPLRSGNKTFTIADLIETEQLTCQAGTELTFKLISFAHYLDTDTTWKDARGQDWSIPRLIAEELRKPITRFEPCGGSHRLMGLSYAVYKRQKEGKPIDGEFKRAETFTAQHRERMLEKLQNRDGSFSTMWFERPEARPDADRRLQTSGHMLEWLVFSVPDEDLTALGVVRGVQYIATLLGNDPRRQWEIGPMGHGLHALRIYDRRLFKPFDADEKLELAQRETRASEAAAGDVATTIDANEEHAAETPAADDVAEDAKPTTTSAPATDLQKAAQEKLKHSAKTELQVEGPILFVP